MSNESTVIAAVTAAPQTALSGQAPVAPVLTDAEPKPKHLEPTPTEVKPKRPTRRVRIPAIVSK